ncbi:hypothetical protein HDU67_009604 [Dinochytrium kinnereticum]|nr:hypothetical protein HDU67_009604 [Dinochytrium kinnereticum]
MKRQTCTVDDTRLHFQAGWLSTTDKLIPLDRIQDLAVSQGILARCCGVSNLEVQTAGSGSAGAEAYLIAPKNPKEVRDMIMKKRDALVLGGGGGGGKPVVEAQPGASPEMLAEVKAIRDVVARIERQVEQGVRALRAPPAFSDGAFEHVENPCPPKKEDPDQVLEHNGTTKADGL